MIRNTVRRGGLKKRKPIEYKGVGYTNGKKVKIEQKVQPKIEYEKHNDKSLEEIQYVFGNSKPLPSPYFFPVKLDAMPPIFEPKSSDTISPFISKDNSMPPPFKLQKDTSLPDSKKLSSVAPLAVDSTLPTAPKILTQPPVVERIEPVIYKQSTVIFGTNPLESKISRTKFNWSKVEDEHLTKIQPKGNPTRKFKWSSPNDIAEELLDAKKPKEFHGATAHLFGAIKSEKEPFKSCETGIKTEKSFAVVEDGINISAFGASNAEKFPVFGAGAEKVLAFEVGRNDPILGKSSEDIQMGISGVADKLHSKSAAPFIFGSTTTLDISRMPQIDSTLMHQSQKESDKLQQQEYKHKELYQGYNWSIPSNDLPENIISRSKTHQFTNGTRVFKWKCLISQADNGMVVDPENTDVQRPSGTVQFAFGSTSDKSSNPAKNIGFSFAGFSN